MGLKTFTAILHRNQDIYVAECTEIGTVSQGKTIEEAIENPKEAAELYLEELPFENYEKSIVITEPARFTFSKNKKESSKASFEIYTYEAIGVICSKLKLFLKSTKLNRFSKNTFKLIL